jgi:hypothetical protein
MSELFGVGDIAARLKVPTHRVEYAIKTRKIDPLATIPGRRVFGADQLAQIRDVLAATTARRRHKGQRIS